MTGTMSYKGFSWPNNPQSITYRIAEKESTALLPGGHSRVARIAEQPRVVEGKGFFYGSQAHAYMNRLEQIFLDQASGILFLPNRRPMYARFTELTVLEQVKKDMVGYTFVFTEDRDKIPAVQNSYEACTWAEPGETLFHVAARTGVTVEELGRLNSLPGCFALTEGMEVRLK